MECLFQWQSQSSGQQWQQQSQICPTHSVKTEQVRLALFPALVSTPTKDLGVAITHRPCIPITIASLKYKGWSSSEHSCLPARNYGCNTPLESWSQYSGGTAQTTAGRHQARPRRCQSNPCFNGRVQALASSGNNKAQSSNSLCQKLSK